MSKVVRQLECGLWCLLIAVALSGLAFSQVQADKSSSTRDVFFPVHESLSAAADRSLAAALANQSWINTPHSSVSGQPTSSKSYKNRVLKLRQAIDSVDQLRPILEPIRRDEGVPGELSAVVLVESGGLTNALSPKGARGVWQFIPDTARRYGLVVDAGHDDRTDVVKSTRAASRYLRDLYATFGDWSLALAAYNAGEAAVTDAINKAKSRDFGSISRRGFLPLETRNYVPAVMAAMNRLQYVADQVVGTQSKGTRVVYALSGAAE